MRFLFIVIASLPLAHALGQGADSTSLHASEKLMAYQSKFDSASERVNHLIDSVQMKSKTVLNTDLVGTVGVLLQQSKRRIDSVKKLDELKGNLQHKIDSLSEVNLPTGKYGGKLDSLMHLKLPSEVTDKVYDLKQLPQPQVDKAKSINEHLHGKADKVNELVDKTQAYQQDALAVVKGDLDELKTIPGAVENKVASLDEVRELQKQGGELSGYHDWLESGNNPGMIKERAKELALKYATDHFAGKQEMLKSAIDKVTKLRGNYSRVTSLKDVPSRVTNPMKGKPLIERMVPGFTFQIQKSGTFMIDLSPTIAYRFTGRFASGVGWNERLSFSKWNKLVPDDRILGPRVFSSFAFRKGFSLKAEVEKMNVYLPTFTPNAEGSRAWVWSAFAGFKKDYTFYKKVKGNVQMLYNLYDDHDNSPYMDRLNVRMGFEIGMKKKRKPGK